MLQRFVGAQRTGRAGPYDAALLDDVMAIGEPRQGGHVLVDDQDRQTLALQPFEALPDLGADRA